MIADGDKSAAVSEMSGKGNRENLPQCHFVTINIHSNPGFRVGKPATNRPNYGTA
jgi:hypothetical protein